MRKPKICLIVDNPLRDLDGMVLLGWTLAQKGAEAFLVPMYHQAAEVAALMPDLVLVNYLRLNNHRLVEAYSKCGILVGVLDTEGGILNNVEEELTKLVARSKPSNIALYCLWGRRQYDSFIKNEILPKEKLFVTGCPRYDFCASPWKSSLPNTRYNSKPIILINTRFSLIFPRYQRRLEDEINTMLNLGYEQNYVREYVRECFLVWAELVNTTANLAKSFSQAVFVVRPHPFEDKRIYEQVFKDVPNIRIEQEGTVLPWINSSLLLIQRDCSTAVEASFLGVEPISLGWIDAPMLNNEVICKVSQNVKCKKRLFDIVENTLKGNPIRPNSELKSKRAQIINDWFYAVDGKSSERVANAILETANKEKNTQLKRKPASIILHNGFTRAGLKDAVNFLGNRILGFDRFDKLKSQLVDRPRTISKDFNVQDVKSIINRLSEVSKNSKIVKVERIRNKHCSVKIIGHHSIRLYV